MRLMTGNRRFASSVGRLMWVLVSPHCGVCRSLLAEDVWSAAYVTTLRVASGVAAFPQAQMTAVFPVIDGVTGAISAINTNPFTVHVVSDAAHAFAAVASCPLHLPRAWAAALDP